ncbi:putative repeat protein (TIGR02543 family)/RHS repeat-associated protein [Methylobacter tundripaludum]|uniref:Putative repeat protein (TIGR02543 family)/RHS repeat-associated protein n=1 Tax=Methylobacter tundripaludum TaxID=173365 RepID=A0A2S6HEY9_9GAMM|nr:RHS repeat-associated core domain-containing protein [Methylobacter tundripaludum]PPK76059.1 putative repeat protein (TIGR02543 family)/RHS repeat-associated protein [Methylobacter tundripaludum]
MKSITKNIFVLVALLLATLFTTGLAQADDKTHAAKKNDKTSALKITKAGAGEATITSFPDGINCGETCRAEFKTQSRVTLTATAASGSIFKRWGGACKDTATTCTVTLKEAQNVTAITELLPITLNVSKAGSGTGTVTSVPAGIDCGITCSTIYSPKLAAQYDDSRKTREHEDGDDDDGHKHDDEHEHDHGKPAASVTLTAAPATGSTFQGWTGACTGTAATCTVTMDQTKSVSANFALMQMTLSVAKTGTGTGGTITSLQTGIDCGATCSGIYDWGTPVTLVATPATGSVFKGWTDACTGTAATCTVTLDKNQNVSADFAPMQMTLTTAKTGSGTGAIASSPAGIDCGAACTGIYDWSTPVTLTATPATDSTFQGWTGACTGTATTCTVTLDQTQNVSADFAPAFKTLSLTKAGSGTGTLTSSPAGIDCGATCSADFPTNTQVTLSASPATGSTFQGWFGACTGTATTCIVTLNQAKTVNATFSAPAITTYQYDANGNLTQITDPLGRIRQYQYDALNQSIHQLEPHPNIIGSTLGQIDTTYDSLGQVTGVTDPRNLTTRYNIDSLGDLQQQTSPDTGITEASHDPAGNLKTRTDARGKNANYSYDSLNRISQIAYDDQTVNYTWDNCANGINRLCSLSNNNSTVSYGYDSHGRITQKSQNTGATPLTVSHSYNAAGQRIASLSPGGQTLEYQWIGNHITAIYSNGQPVISQISYEPDGQVNGWNWGNNQQNERFYDLAGRNIIVSMGFDAQSQMPDSRYYGYDAAGRQTSAIDDVDPNLNQQHQYDQLDRLTGSQRGEPQISRTDYSYDLSGNRSEKIKDNTTLYSYSTDANSNRLQSQSGAQTVNYSYDPAGNLTSDGTFSHSYNAAGRRIATTNTITAQTTSYGYDALGQRISKTNAGNTTQFFYDEQGHLTGEYDASGQLIQEIIWLGDLPVAVLKPATNSAATPDIYYIHADHLGTPRKITRPNDNRVVWSWESEAFGNSLPDQNPAGLGDFVFNLRFPGQYYDQETGLYYNMARYYNPRTGGYDQSDPIGLAGGINTYAYVRNNPVNLTDPSGLIVPVVVEGVEVAAEACAANPACAAAVAEGAVEAAAAGEAVAATATGAAETVGAACKTLGKQAEKGIRSLLKRITEHEQKLNDFKANPTVRPGMEGQPQEVIEAAQQARINHLETEIQTFKNNVQKLMKGQ